MLSEKNPFIRIQNVAEGCERRAGLSGNVWAGPGRRFPPAPPHWQDVPGERSGLRSWMLQASRTNETPQLGSRLLNNAHINDVNLDGANSSDGGFIPTQILRKTNLGSRWLEDAI